MLSKFFPDSDISPPDSCIRSGGLCQDLMPRLQAIFSQEITKLSNVSVNPLFDSELERKFIEALSRMNSENRRAQITKALVNNKEGYILNAKDMTWEIEPQVDFDPTSGIADETRPDFVIRPLHDVKHKPVAVYTDGFRYHKDSVGKDSRKREAIRRSGNYRVWVFSYQDVQEVVQKQGDFSTNSLAAEKMPAGSGMYQPMLNAGNKGEIIPGKMSQMELLMHYLTDEDAEESFMTHARAYRV